MTTGTLNLFKNCKMLKERHLTTFAGRVEANSASYMPPRKTEKHP
jgi:hypothetical protein